jgi:palmitoyltransferase ZDHHC4
MGAHSCRRLGRRPEAHVWQIYRLFVSVWKVHDERPASNRYGRHSTTLNGVWDAVRTNMRQVFFILLMAVSEYLYLPTAWPRMSLSQRLSATVTVILPYLFLYLAAYSDPGYITPANHARHLALYPYDYSIFGPGNECRTCRITKPARSKHCSICKRCIAKLDHHCIFINGCVGYGNHHWFVLLLLSTAFLCSYGGLLGASLLSAKIQAHYPLWRIWKPAKMDLKDYLVLWGWGLQDHVGMGSVTLLALMVSPLVWGLLGYTVWLIYCGTTTNETLKWSDWKAEMSEGYAFMRAMPENRTKDPNLEAVWSRWPKQTEQILITTRDGRPPGPDEPIPGVGEWERAWSLKNVENIYDLGFWDNLKDVFIPNYSFSSSGHEPAAERRKSAKRPVRTSPL